MFITTSEKPDSLRRFKCRSNRLSPLIFIKGLGSFSVKGMSRSPRPAANIIAFKVIHPEFVNARGTVRVPKVPLQCNPLAENGYMNLINMCFDQSC